MRQAIFGIFFTFSIALLARWVAVMPFWPFTIAAPSPHPIDHVVLAILFGMGIKHFLFFPDSWKEGTQFVIKKLLPVAIVLMGARLDFNVILSVSWQALWINLICVPLVFLLTLLLCKWAQIGQKMAILVGIGTAICGGSAIIVAAPIIEADEAETSLSITTITLFGILAIFFYPLLGYSLGLNEMQFGIWVGTAIQAVPQVIAAGFAYSDIAGECSLLVKLVRILFLAPFILGLSIWYHKRNSYKLQQKGKKTSWKSFVPPFLIGFVIMAVLSTLGWISDFSVGGQMVHTKLLLSKVSSFFITMAMVAIGLGANMKGFIKAKVKVLGIGFLSAIILGTISYSLIKALT